ncbi:MAG: polysaccharide deacetylase family protein [Chloroflexota bacterium]|nr:polysaccharide deacetylase family protein [Chloroflexota bacterium]
MPGRAPLRWPNGARIAVWVVPNIESFALDEPIAGGTGTVPDVPAWSVREYGARIGVFRIMDVLRRHGVRGTVALNADVCGAYPEVVAATLDLGWELMGHGVTNTRRLSAVADEAVVVRETFERIERATGTRPVGWLSPGLQETWDTLDHLAASGARYVADWTVDDQPIWLSAGGTRLVGVPYTFELNDKPAYERMGRTPDEFAATIRRQFDVLYAESATSGRVMAIALHPYLSGYPHRIGAIDDALGYVRSHDGVWLATGREIADAFREAMRG